MCTGPPSSAPSVRLSRPLVGPSRHPHMLAGLTLAALAMARHSCESRAWQQQQQRQQQRLARNTPRRRNSDGASPRRLAVSCSSRRDLPPFCLPFPRPCATFTTWQLREQAARDAPYMPPSGRQGRARRGGAATRERRGGRAASPGRPRTACCPGARCCGGAGATPPAHSSSSSSSSFWSAMLK